MRFNRLNKRILVDWLDRLTQIANVAILKSTNTMLASFQAADLAQHKNARYPKLVFFKREKCTYTVGITDTD